MKISKTINKLFGLEDLKGLISESYPGEWDWPGFFDQDPTRQDIHFNELMGLKSWLEKNGISSPNSSAANTLLANLTPEQIEDIKNTVGTDVSPIRKYFGDDTFLDALRTPGNFRKMKDGKFDNKRGSYSKFRRGIKGRKETMNGKQRESYAKKKNKKQANDNLVQPDVVHDNIDKPKTLDPELDNVRRLEKVFKSLGGDKIQVPDFKEKEDVKSYVDAINKLAKNAANTYGEEIPDFFINYYYPGDPTNPFYFFLLFYYFYNRGKSAKMLGTYKENIKNPDVKNYVEYIFSFFDPKNTANKEVELSVNKLFLEPIGLTFTEISTDVNVEKLYDTYFSDESKILEFWKTLKSSSFEKNIRLKKGYSHTIGGVLTSAMYILLFNKGANIDILGQNLSYFIPSDGVEKLIRSMVYYVKYKIDFSGVPAKDSKKFDETVGELERAFGVPTIYDLFDPLSTVDNATISNALKAVIGIQDDKINEAKFFFDNGLDGDKIKKKLVFYSSFGLPQHDTVFTLTPFERFVDMAKGGQELLKENLDFDVYGGDVYGVVSNIFKTASQVYGEDTGALQKIENLKRDAETIYGEDLTYGQLITYDISQRDKTQREIYRFLLSNLPVNIMEKYEYNRGSNKIADESLGQQSIDILCTTYTGKMDDASWIEEAKESGDKTICVEYQGEGHFRPRFLRPRDYSEDPEDGILYWATEIYKDILLKYEEYESKIEGRWFRDDMKEDMIKLSFEKYYRDITGIAFNETYSKFNPFLMDLDTFRKTYALNEGSDVQADEANFISPNGRAEVEIMQYLYAMLIQVYGIPVGKNTEIPQGFILKRKSKGKNSAQALSRVYPAKKAGYTINYILSMHRFSEEIHTIGQKVSDRDKSNLVKGRNWALLYILPSETLETTTEEDFSETQRLANPSSFVFRWDSVNQEAILTTIKNYLAKPVEQLSENSLFKSIVKELLDDNNFQLN